MTAQQQLAAFLADVRQTNPRLNVNDRYGTRTSIEALINYLQAHVHHAAPLTVMQAVQMCGNPNDQRITKYLPAIQRLVSVWGNGSDYPTATGASAVIAAGNFYRYIQLLPHNERFDYETLLRYSENAAGFGVTTAPTGYVARVPNPNGGNLDITSRGLVLRSGLVPECNGFADMGYMTRLHLTPGDLQNMANHSIADVGCGAAVFRAEMETLFGCATTGLDLNYNLVPNGTLTVSQRYPRSILYLKMLADTNRLNVTLTPPSMAALITRLAENIDPTLTAYRNNLPVSANIFNLGPAMVAYNNGHAWDYIVTMYLLCYFTPQEQTDAVLSMCGAANRGVLIYNGSGAGPGIHTQVLTYDQNVVRQSFQGCNIVVKDAATHHIYL
jgi:hypothetical protein